MIHQTPTAYVEGRHYVLATDGACNGNPGTGGWGAVIQLRDGSAVLRQRCIAGQDIFTPKSRMVLLAPVKALTMLKEDIPTVVVSDSEYLVRGMTEWLDGWKHAGWRSSSGPLQHRDLWEELEGQHQKRCSLDWYQVPGKPLPWLNQVADTLCHDAANGAFPDGEKDIRKVQPKWFI